MPEVFNASDLFPEGSGLFRCASGLSKSSKGLFRSRQGLLAWWSGLKQCCYGVLQAAHWFKPVGLWLKHDPVCFCLGRYGLKPLLIAFFAQRLWSKPEALLLLERADTRSKQRYQLHLLSGYLVLSR